MPAPLNQSNSLCRGTIGACGQPHRAKLAAYTAPGAQDRAATGSPIGSGKLLRISL
jgi:hypothetical protein